MFGITATILVGGARGVFLDDIHVCTYILLLELLMRSCHAVILLFILYTAYNNRQRIGVWYFSAQIKHDTPFRVCNYFYVFKLFCMLSGMSDFSTI